MTKIGKRLGALSIAAASILFVAPCLAGVPLAIDSQEPLNVAHRSSTSPLTWNFTNLAGNELFVGCVVTNAGATAPTISTPTYGGTSMTLVPGSSNTRITANSTTIVVYRLDDPAVGTNQVSVPYSGGSALDAICGALSMRGVGSVGSATSAQGAGTTASVSLGGTTSGDFVLSLVSSGSGVVKASAPNTTSSRLNVSQNTNGDNAALGQEATPGGTVTPTYAVVNDNWVEDVWEVFSAGDPALGPACGAAPPPAASAAGLTTLNFCDDFNYTDTSFIDFTGTDNKLWTAGLWFDPFGSPNSWSISSGILTENLNNADNGGFSQDLTTVHHDLGGGAAFTPPFYAEARMSGADWFAFWFAALPHARSQFVSSNPSTYAAEIDVIEGASHPQHTSLAPTTLHRNAGSGNGLPDTQLDCFGDGPTTGNGLMPSGSNQRQYHTYAVLAQGAPGNVTWYVDGVATCQAAAFDSTQTIYMMIINAVGNGNGTQGGIFQDTNNPPVDPLVQPEVGTIDWVRVWTR